MVNRVRESYCTIHRIRRNCRILNFAEFISKPDFLKTGVADSTFFKSERLSSTILPYQHSDVPRLDGFVAVSNRNFDMFLEVSAVMCNGEHDT